MELESVLSLGPVNPGGKDIVPSLEFLIVSVVSVMIVGSGI